MTTIPTVDQLGAIPEAFDLTEKSMVLGLARHLERLGFEASLDATTAPRFPGFKFPGGFNEHAKKKLTGVKRNPDARPIDLLAWRDSLVLLIEAKIADVERGLGQILLYGSIYRENRLDEGQQLILVLAAPDFKWHRHLPPLVEACGVVVWALNSGQKRPGGAQYGS